MSAESIIYCLENLTDYRQFERLCSDVMNQSGYTDIEPLGGSSDRGRDATHIARKNPDDITIFTYTVRADWKDAESTRPSRVVLAEDRAVRASVHKRIQAAHRNLQRLGFPHYP